MLVSRLTYCLDVFSLPRSTSSDGVRLFHSESDSTACFAQFLQASRGASELKIREGSHSTSLCVSSNPSRFTRLHYAQRRIYAQSRLLAICIRNQITLQIRVDSLRLKRVAVQSTFGVRRFHLVRCTCLCLRIP